MSLKRAVLLVVVLASFLTPFMASGVNVALPQINRDYPVSASMITWVVTAYLLSTSAIILPLGRLADLIGRKKVFLGGVVGYTLFSVLCPLATSFSLLIAFRLLQGVGGAMVFSTGVAILTSAYPPGERGAALGINVAAVYLGISLGPPLGGLLIETLGWPSLFYLTAGVGVLVLAVSLTVLKGAEWKGEEGRFDGVGGLLSGLSIGLLVFGLSTAGGNWWNLAYALAGLLCLTVFVWWENHTTTPLLNLRLFARNKVFAFSNLAALINYASTFFVSVLLSLYLQTVRGFTAEKAGLVLLAQPLIQALFSIPIGRVCDRIPPRLLASVGMVLSTLSLFLFVFLQDQTPLWMVVANLILLGLGFALFSTPNTYAVMESVEMKFYGVASSVLGTMRLFGQATSMALIAMIFSLFLGQSTLAPSMSVPFMAASRVAFLLSALLSVVGVFASLARPPGKKSSPPSATLAA